MRTPSRARSPLTIPPRRIQQSGHPDQLGRAGQLAQTGDGVCAVQGDAGRERGCGKPARGGLEEGHKGARVCVRALAVDGDRQGVGVRVRAAGPACEGWRGRRARRFPALQRGQKSAFLF